MRVARHHILAGAIAMIGGPSMPAFAADRAPATIYARTCGYCHGHNVGPILFGRNLPPELVTIMVRGGKGAMPAFRPTEISPDELKHLASWIAAAPVSSREHGR